MNLDGIEPQWLWLIAAAVIGLAELLIPGVFLIWLAVAAALTGLVAALFGIPLPFQLAAFGIFSIASVYLGRNWYAKNRVESSDPLLNDRGGRMIGETVEVVSAIRNGAGRVKVGDSVWPARGPDADVGACVRVIGSDGACLKVEAAAPAESCLPPSPMELIRDDQADVALVRDRRIAIFGYGNQGRAQALNLRDSGVSQLVLALRDGGSADRARADGFDVVPMVEAAAWADIVVLLTPDETHTAIYGDSIVANLRPGGAIGFAHGLSIRFGLIAPRPDLDIFLLAPKGPGTALRSEYQGGSGLLALFAVHQDASGEARRLALSYGAALGCGRVGMLETSFAEESEADIFNEAAVLWGAIPELILAGFETLTEAGYSPEVAYLECVTEVKLIADLIHARGIAGMREAISNTAEFAALQGGRRIIDERARTEMRRLLRDVQSGLLVRDLVADGAAGYPMLKASRERAQSHAIEAVASKLPTSPR